MSMLRLLGWSLAGLVLLGPVLVVVAWWRDRQAYDRAFQAEGPEARIQALQTFISGRWRCFLVEDARGQIDRIRTSVDSQRFDSAMAIADPAARGKALERYLAEQGPLAASARQARQELATTDRQRQEARIAATAGLADPTVRLSTLKGLTEELAGQAELLRLVERELARTLADLDHADWQLWSLPGDPDLLCQRLQHYLDRHPQGAHAGAARDRLARLQPQVESQDREQEDTLRWQAAVNPTDPGERLKKIEAYLAVPGALRRVEAETLAEQLRTSIANTKDDQVWEAARTLAEATARGAALRQYLADPQMKRHRGEAQELLAGMLGADDEGAWQAATAAGKLIEQLARLEAYLKRPTPRRYDGEARTQILHLRQKIDAEAWGEAMRPLDPVQRLAALARYQTGDTLKGFADQAKEAELKALREIGAADPDFLSKLSVELLVRLDDAALARLPPAALGRLPDDRLLRLDGQILATLEPERLGRLPIVAQARVAVRPAWAAEAGSDATGRWARLAGPKLPLRFRHIFPGRCTYQGNNYELLQGVWLAETELSQKHWVGIRGGVFSSNNPSPIEGNDLPVHNLDPDNLRRFLGEANDYLLKEKIPGRLRLPTANEWAFAALTSLNGPKDPYPQAGLRPTSRVLAIAWCFLTAQERPHTIGTLPPDAWGLRDLFGNVAELCTDGENCIACGGHYLARPDDCGPLSRLPLPQTGAAVWTGLRLVAEGR